MTHGPIKSQILISTHCTSSSQSKVVSITEHTCVQQCKLKCHYTTMRFVSKLIQLYLILLHYQLCTNSNQPGPLVKKKKRRKKEKFKKKKKKGVLWVKFPPLCDEHSQPSHQVKANMSPPETATINGKCSSNAIHHWLGPHMTEEQARETKLSQSNFLGQTRHCQPILLDIVDVTKYFLSGAASVGCAPQMLRAGTSTWRRSRVGTTGNKSVTSRVRRTSLPRRVSTPRPVGEACLPISPPETSNGGLFTEAIQSVLPMVALDPISSTCVRRCPDVRA